MKNEVETFLHRFDEFIKPYNCHTHQKNPTFVCIDANCKDKGLICSTCLTINGNHKNHDSIEINEFMEQCLKAFSKDLKKAEMTELIKRIDESYEELLRILTDFHENFSNVIKGYINKKNELHSER